MKGILNQLAERAEAVGERVAILGYEAPARDPWGLIAIQRL
jgi:hypothetical protein